MKFVAKVYEPFYDHNDKKYIRFVIPQKVSEIIERMHASRMHLLVNQNADNPLDGSFQLYLYRLSFEHDRLIKKLF